MNEMAIGTLTVLPVIGIAAGFVCAAKWVSVRPNEAKIITNKGNQYLNTFAEPGYHIKPFFSQVAATISTAFYTQEVSIKTRTADYCLVNWSVDIFYRVSDPARYYMELHTKPNAHVSNPDALSTPADLFDFPAMIESVAHENIGKKNLLDLYSNRKDFLDTVQQNLQRRVKKYGIIIESTLGNNFDPGETMKAFFNRSAMENIKREGFKEALKPLTELGFSIEEAAEAMARYTGDETYRELFVDKDSSEARLRLQKGPKDNGFLH